MRGKTGKRTKSTGRTVKSTGRTVKSTGRTAKSTGRTVKSTGRTAKKRRTVKTVRHTVRATKSSTSTLRREITQYMDGNGYLSWSAKEGKYTILGTNSPKNGLVQCPACGLGQLMLIRSRTTRKRFIGCSNFYGGCSASAPLLQKARLRATKTACVECGWPMIIFRYSIRQKWTRQCSNISCASRQAKAD